MARILIMLGKALRVLGNIFIMFLFAMNVIVAWKDVRSPYWLFNFVMLGMFGVTFYLLNTVACCWDDDPEAGDIFGSYPAIRSYGAIFTQAKDSPPPYSALQGAQDAPDYSYGAKWQSFHSDASTNQLHSNSLHSDTVNTEDPSANELPAYDEVVKESVVDETSGGHRV